MAVFFIFILRIFSETFSMLSSAIGLFTIVYLLFLIFPFNRVKIPEKNILFNYLLIYLSIEILGVLIGFVAHGSILLKPSVYYCLKSVSIVSVIVITNSYIDSGKINIEKIFKIVLCIYAIIGIFSVFSVVVGFSPLVNGDLRASWPTGHPNSLGILFSTITAYMFISGNVITDFRLRCFLSSCFLFGMFATKSVSAIAVFTIIICLHLTTKVSLKKILLVVVPLVVAILFFNDVFLGERLSRLSFDYDRYLYLWNTGHGPFQSSFEWRITNWRALFDEFLKRPFLGHGTVSWMLVNPLRNFPGPLGGYEPHSELFNWLIQYGVIGTLVLSFVTVRTAAVLLWSAVKNKHATSFNYIFTASLIAGFLGKQLLYIQLFFILTLIYFVENNQRKDTLNDRDTPST